MRHWVAMVVVALIGSGAALADPPSARSTGPAVDWDDIARRVDARMDSALEAKTDAALRHHKVAAEAGRDAGGCRQVVAAAAAQGANASERHRRLTACLAQLRARDSMLAGKQP